MKIAYVMRKFKGEILGETAKEWKKSAIIIFKREILRQTKRYGRFHVRA